MAHNRFCFVSQVALQGGWLLGFTRDELRVDPNHLGAQGTFSPTIRHTHTWRDDAL